MGFRLIRTFRLSVILTWLAALYFFANSLELKFLGVLQHLVGLSESNFLAFHFARIFFASLLFIFFYFLVQIIWHGEEEELYYFRHAFVSVGLGFLLYAAVQVLWVWLRLNSSGTITLDLSLWAQFRENGEIFLSAFLSAAASSILWGLLIDSQVLRLRQGFFLAGGIFLWLILMHQLQSHSMQAVLLSCIGFASGGGLLLYPFLPKERLI